jgi:ribonuclease I
MPLPWVRLDTNIAQHDKVQRLLKAEPSPKRWQAFTSYVCSIGWSGGAGSDGAVPSYALETIYGTTTTARLLVMHGLWEESPTGWQIHNFGDYQQVEAVTRAKSEAAARAARIRWNGGGSR